MQRIDIDHAGCYLAYMRSNVNSDLFQALGFRWCPVELPLAQPPNQERAMFRLKKLFPEMVFDIARLEGNPHTYPEVQTLLEGITVGGHLLSDAEQILNQRDALTLLMDLVRRNKFALTSETFCALQAVAAKGEALTTGRFRDGGVGIGGTEWRPPAAQDLPQIFKRGVDALSQLKHPLEKGLAFFLFGARNQFFYDGNKRSSRLMLNGVLLSAGQDVLTIPAKLRHQFNAKMVKFYSTGEATEMFAFLGKLQISSRFNETSRENLPEMSLALARSVARKESSRVQSKLII